MKFALLAIAAIVGPACAQLSGLSPCAIGCLTASISASGCSLTNTTCLCASAAFHDGVASCLKSKCTAADIAAVLAFQAKTCGASS